MFTAMKELTFSPSSHPQPTTDLTSPSPPNTTTIIIQHKYLSPPTLLLVLKALAEKQGSKDMDTKDILQMPEFQRYSYEQVRIAQEFLKMNKVHLDGSEYKSCPVGLDKHSKQCKGLMAMPPFSACKKFSTSAHGSTISEALATKGQTALHVAKDKLKNVPYAEIRQSMGEL
jgi:hypothetical protein